MMAFIIVENIRGYFGSRPPLVAFMIFLASMAVGLVTFAYFASDMPKAVVDQEFNKFMERLSSVNLCVGMDSSSSSNDHGITSSDSSSSSSASGTVRGSMASPLQQQQSTASLKAAAARGKGGYFVESMKQDNRPMLVKRALPDGKPGVVAASSTERSTATSSLTLVNVSMMMMVQVASNTGFPRATSASHHRNTTTIITAPLLASQLGQAKRNHEIQAVMTMVLPPLANHSIPCQFLGSSHGKEATQCHRVKACVTITAPRQFFPRTMRPDSHDVCHREAEPKGANPVHGDVVMGFDLCSANNATLVHLLRIFDSQNRAIAYMPERSTINLHLMHSSYFLFVMVISLFCYAIIRGRPAKVKMMHVQNGNSDKHALMHV